MSVGTPKPTKLAGLVQNNMVNQFNFQQPGGKDPPPQFPVCEFGTWVPDTTGH